MQEKPNVISPILSATGYSIQVYILHRTGYTCYLAFLPPVIRMLPLGAYFDAFDESERHQH